SLFSHSLIISLSLSLSHTHYVNLPLYCSLSCPLRAGASVWYSGCECRAGQPFPGQLLADLQGGANLHPKNHTTVPDSRCVCVCLCVWDSERERRRERV